MLSRQGWKQPKEIRFKVLWHSQIVACWDCVWSWYILYIQFQASTTVTLFYRNITIIIHLKIGALWKVTLFAKQICWNKQVSKVLSYLYSFTLTGISDTFWINLYDTCLSLPCITMRPSIYMPHDCGHLHIAHNHIDFCWPFEKPHR